MSLNPVHLSTYALGMAHGARVCKHARLVLDGSMSVYHRSLRKVCLAHAPIAKRSLPRLS
jgi:hypothetical protein